MLEMLPQAGTLDPRFGSPIQVKICGIMREADALHAASVGADMVGIVFAPSRRQVTHEAAARIVASLTSLEQHPLTVGVFVNETDETIYTTAASVGLDIIQLSGDESPQQVGRIARRHPVIKALRFPHETSVSEAVNVCDEYLAAAPQGRVQLLIDTYQHGSYGGTGETSDWGLAAQLSAHYPIFVAGGLNPKNIADAVASISPFGVDVSSGVERDGRKDSSLIAEFIQAAKGIKVQS
ncbi:MAG: phosphoribosylanthranilate isomerase [Chloroflexia bacterium]